MNPSTLCFHGCSTESAVRSILDQGHLIGRDTQGKSQLAPIVGRVYLSRSAYYAGIYALGGDMFGHSQSEERMAKKGRTGTLFAIDTASLPMAQALPDEDFVGSFVEKAHSFKKKGREHLDWLEENGFVREHRAMSHFLENDRLADRVIGIGRNYMTPLQYKGAIDGLIAAQAAGGKRVLKNCPQYDRDLLLSFCEDFSVPGPVPVLAAWQFDKTRAKDLPRCPSLREILAICEPAGPPSMKAVSETLLSLMRPKAPAVTLSGVKDRLAARRAGQASAVAAEAAIP